MTFAGQLRKSGQTLAVTRRTRTGARDADGLPVETILPVVSDVPCLAEEYVGREVLTPSGERVIGDWGILLIADPGILPRDILTLTPGGRVLSAINHPIGNVLGRVKVFDLVAQSGGKP